MRRNKSSLAAIARVATLSAAFAATLAAAPAAAQTRSLLDLFTGKGDQSQETIQLAQNQAMPGGMPREIDTFEPILSYDTAYNLALAINMYEQIVANGGWGQLPQEVYGLVPGRRSRDVRYLRRRLIISGDLPQEAGIDSRHYDEQVEAAVRLFQARHGLKVNGAIDQPTFFSMNVPASERLAQLKLNQQRVEQIVTDNLSERYVVVNIPAASIEAVENGTVVQRHTAIVGRIDRQTPILESKIHQINFNPYWHVPKSIIQRDLIKYMNENPNYLAEQQIKIYDGNGNEIQASQIDWHTDEAVNYLFRQEPGAENSMGHVKINFYNKHNVYLHDTPQKSLFGEANRFHSSGCVRVEGVEELVAWLLESNGYDVNTVEATFNSGERLDVSLNRQVPILTTYISAWANRAGVVQFRDDIYDFDATGQLASLEQ